MPSLEECKKAAVKQAKDKKWNITRGWLKKKFRHEVNEFLRAVDKKGNGIQISRELADVIVVGTQIAHKLAKKQNLDKAYTNKITDNYNKKKKTWDSKKKKVVRK